jgi:hypothetical protein
VYLLSKTGQTKRALFLIIDKLADVSQAIAFAKQQDDPDLWNDLLDYSMDKPRFIRGLLEEVGTAIDPITLVRRIPEGLEIEGLREGLIKMIKEYEIQHSISEGVARVLRGEVTMSMDELRTGQKKGVRFDVIQCSETHVDVESIGAMENQPKDEGDALSSRQQHRKLDSTLGNCVKCNQPFLELGEVTLSHW